MKTNKPSILAAIFFFLSFSISFAGNYSWTGTTGTDWSTGTNWSPAGTPSANDSVTITNQTNNPVLAANTDIKRITMTSGVLDCNGYTLTISALATFNAGTINNGTVTCSGTSTITFAGTTFGAAISATGNNILFNGSTFNSTLTAIKKGSSSDNGTGGNIFNGAVTFIDSGSGNLVLGNNTAADTFYAALTLTTTSTGSILLAHQSTGNYFSDVTCNTGGIVFNQYGSSSFTGNIVLNSSSRNIYFGYSTGSSTLSSGKSISIGGSGFSAGTLTLKGFVQSGSSLAISLSLSGSATLEILSGSIFNTNLNVSAPILTLSGARFLGTDSLTHAGSQNGSSSGCYFGGSTYISNTAPVTNYTFTLGTSVADTFATTATINDVGTGTIAIKNGLFKGSTLFKNSVTTTLSSRYSVATSGTVTIKGALTLDCIYSGMLFGSSGGTTVLDTSATISLVSGFAGELNMKNVTQNNTTATSFNMSTNTASGNNTIFKAGAGCIFNGSFTYIGQRLQLNGATYNGTTRFTRFNASDDASTGGNVFNGTTYITDSVIAHSHTFSLANSTADDFNGNVTFKQYGTSSSSSLVKIYPAYTKNSTFAGNVTVDGTSAIEFGTNGGKVIFDGSGTQTLSKSGSYVPSFKRIQVNKSAGIVSLGYPLTLADTLFLTKGVIATDTTNLITVPDNGIVSGGSDSSYIHGPLKKVGDDAFTFTLGDTSLHTYSYHPLGLTAPSSNSDSYTISYYHAAQGLGNTTDSTIENISVCDYWKYDRNNGTSTVTATLGWNLNSCNVYQVTDMRVGYWNGIKWIGKGKASTTGSTSVGNVTASATVSSSGYLILADAYCSTFTSAISNSENVKCYGDSTGSAIALAAGGTFPSTYSWSYASGTNDSISDLPYGTYTVFMADAHGCSDTDTVTITQPTALSLTVASTTNLTCYGSSDGESTVHASGGITPYSYEWSPSGGYDTTAYDLDSGIYTVTLTDSNSCIKTVLDTIDHPTQVVSVSKFSTDETCYNSSANGTAKVIPVGNPNIYTYSWNIYPDQTDTLASDLVSGQYKLTITDSLGNCQIETLVVGYESKIQASIIATAPTHEDSTNGTAIVNVVGGVGTCSYSWNTSPTQTSDTATDLGWNIYKVTATDSLGCTSAREVNMNVLGGGGCINQLDVRGPISMCSDINNDLEYFLVNGTNGINYNWAVSNGATITVAPNMLSANINWNGTQGSLTVSDASCTTTIFLQDCDCNSALAMIIDYSDEYGPNGARTVANVAADLTYAGATWAGGVNPVLFTGRQLFFRGRFDIEHTPIVFDHCTIYMDKGVIIYTPPITALNSMIFQNNSVLLAGCEYMWQGIRIGQEGALTFNNSSLFDAEYGIVINHKMLLDAENSLFERNYVSIFGNDHTGTSFDCNSIIQSCEFSGLASLVPGHYIGQSPVPQANTSFAAMEYENLQAHLCAFNQGAIPFSTDPNTFNLFHDLNIGIMGELSDIDVYNCWFRDIQPVTAYSQSVGFNGSAIYLHSIAIGSTLSVGNPNTPNDHFANNFLRCKRGVLSIGSINSFINNNIFTLSSWAAAELKNASFANRIISINNNRFRTYFFGIKGANNRSATYTINGNDFIDITPHTPPYLGRSIILGEQTVGTIVSGSILRNTFTNVAIGISSTNLAGTAVSPISILGNREFFNLNQTFITVPHIGIQLFSADHFAVTENLFSRNTAYTGPVNNLRGFLTYQSSNTGVNFNNFLNLGTEIEALGTCNSTQFSCNACTTSTRGFFLNNAWIPSQGGANNANGNSWSNVPLHASGFISLPLNINWFNTGGLFDPNPFSFTGQGIFSAVTTGGLPCNQAIASPTMTDLEDIVSAERMYGDSSDTSQFKFKDIEYAYKLIKSYPAFLDSSDDILNFYNEQSDGNIGKFYLADSLAQLRLWDDALEALEDVDDTTQVESLKKFTMQISYSISGEDRELTTEEQDTLRTIAEMTGWYGGDAVFNARALLDTIIYDSIYMCLPPPSPGPITGSEIAQCGQSGISYYISPVTDATAYSWTTSNADHAVISGPSNLSGVSINFSDSLDTVLLYVRASNSCGSSDTTSAITVTGPPSTPGEISGSTSVCAYDAGTYTTTGSYGATSYAWTIPAGWTIFGSSTGSSINVFFGSSGGNITVAGVNDCDTSAAETLVVNITCRQLLSQKFGENNNFTAFPNPVSRKLTVKFTSIDDSYYELKVSDGLGKVLISKTGKPVIGVNFQELDMVNLANGIYFLNIETTGQKAVIRVSVQ